VDGCRLTFLDLNPVEIGSQRGDEDLGHTVTIACRPAPRGPSNLVDRDGDGDIMDDLGSLICKAKGLFERTYR
jgi:hypothetical protein